MNNSYFFALIAVFFISPAHANEIRIAKAYLSRINPKDLQKSFDSNWGEIGLELIHFDSGSIDSRIRKEVFSCRELESALSSHNWQKMIAPQANKNRTTLQFTAKPSRSFTVQSQQKFPILMTFWKILYCYNIWILY